MGNLLEQNCKNDRREKTQRQSEHHIAERVPDRGPPFIAEQDSGKVVETDPPAVADDAVILKEQLGTRQHGIISPQQDTHQCRDHNQVSQPVPFEIPSPFPAGIRIFRGKYLPDIVDHETENTCNDDGDNDCHRSAFLLFLRFNMPDHPGIGSVFCFFQDFLKHVNPLFLCLG